MLAVKLIEFIYEKLGWKDGFPTLYFIFRARQTIYLFSIFASLPRNK